MTNFLRATIERWPLKAPFSISRYTFTESLVATIRVAPDGQSVGVGECEPHGWDDQVTADMLADAGITPNYPCTPSWLEGLTRHNICERLPRNSLRNGIDCALWDAEAKSNGVRAYELAGQGSNPLPVMPTIGIDSPDGMERRARSFAGAPWLKVKVGFKDGLDEQRLEAVAGAAPSSTLLIDANGGWTPADLKRLLPLLSRLGARIVEQPMTPAYDDCMPRPPDGLMFCADESCLDRRSLPTVRQRYQYINIKLDKAGGLTEALALRAEAERLGLGVMVGMMSGTSLAVAPAFVLAQGLDVVDLELGFMTRDREPAMIIEEFTLQPPDPALWG